MRPERRRSARRRPLVTLLLAPLTALSEEGEALMPPDDYGFSAKFARTNDRFGVSWQLTLPLR